MANKGYHSYRGRRKGRNGKVLLLVLVLLLACGFLYVQRYITYSDDGSIRFDLPFFREQQPDAPEEPGTPETQPEVDLVVEPGPVSAPEEQKEPDPASVVYRVKGLAALPADGAALGEELALVGANGFVCTLRDNTGRVFYDSAAALRSAVEATVSAGALEELCQAEDVLSVARLNALHDSYYAWANMESAGICQSNGHIWYDDLSYHWLETEKDKAREYVIGLAVECAQLGFDQILLEELCYPSGGDLSKIDYSGNTMEKAEALALLLTELRQALEPYGTQLALLIDQRALDPAGNAAYVEASGVELSRLAPLVDAVYVETGDAAAAAEVLAAAVGEEEPPVLVPVSTEPAEDGNWYIP